MLFVLQHLLRQRLRNNASSAGGRGLPTGGNWVDGDDKKGRVTPYLGLNARLSQTWINKWTVLLLLVLARLILLVIGLRSDIASAQREALSACTSVENVGSAIASMPHYLSQGVNELTASGVDHAVDGLMDMLGLTVTGVEEIVVFAINMMTSTYLCLITLVVTGSLHIAVDLLEDVTNFLNKTLGVIGGDIQSGITDFETDLNKVISGIDDALKAVGAKVTIPTINVTSDIAALHNIQLPTDINTALSNLNNSIPTFSQVNNLTQTALRFPFEEVKKLIADHGTNYTFNRSIFTVPPKQSLTFCSDNNSIADFFSKLVDIALLARKIAVILLVLAALAACIPMAYRELRSYRTQKQRSKLIGAGKYDNMDVVYIVSRPYTATAGIVAAEKITTSKRRRDLIRWTVAYATTVPALFVLSLGIAGLFSCLCQYLLLRAITREVPTLTAEVANFADKVVYALTNASSQWANGTNIAILSTQTKINHDLLGWVNTSSSALNDTLNTFVDETISVLNATFGGTVLYDPVTELFNCLIGLKVAGIEKGLTWVSDNAYIDFPLLPNDTFSLGAAASLASNSSNSSMDNFLANPGQTTSDDVTAAVGYLTQKLQDGLWHETVISLTVVAVWVVILLIGVLRALFLWFGRDHDDEAGNGQRELGAKIIGPHEDPFSDDKHFSVGPGPGPTIGPTNLKTCDDDYLPWAPQNSHSSDSEDNIPLKTLGKAFTYTPPIAPSTPPRKPIPMGYGTSPAYGTSPYNASPAPTLPPYSSPARPMGAAATRYPVVVESPAENLGYAGARAVGGAMQKPIRVRNSTQAEIQGAGEVVPGQGF